jgi:hypothetical protein
MTGRAWALLCVSLAALGGCGREEAEAPLWKPSAAPAAPTAEVGPTEGDMAATLFSMLRDRPCQEGQVMAGDIHRGPKEAERLAEGKALDRWLTTNIRSKPNVYRPVSRTERFQNVQEVYVYEEQGRQMELTLSRTSGTSRRAMGETSDREYLQTSAKFCDWVPDHVEILSKTGSAAANYFGISYFFVWRRTNLAQEMMQSGAPQIAMYNASQGGEGRAVLSRQGPDQPWNMQLVQ